MDGVSDIYVCIRGHCFCLPGLVLPESVPWSQFSFTVLHMPLARTVGPPAMDNSTEICPLRVLIVGAGESLGLLYLIYMDIDEAR